MERRTGQRPRQRSRSKMETTAGVWQQSGFTCSAADNFQHTQNPFVCSFCFCLMSSDAKSILGTMNTKSSLSRIDKRTARATGNTRYRYSKIAPLDHKMADDCVSLARTNTVSSTITKAIKTWKTSNESYSYNLWNRINKMYTHDLILFTTRVGSVACACLYTNSYN